MKLMQKACVLGLVLIGGMALAEEAAKDPNVIAWKALMDKNGAAAKALGDMASGKTAFDAAVAATAKATLVEDAKNIPAVFQTQSADPASEAKAAIWTNWDDFVAKAEGLASAAQALDPTSIDGVKNGMAAIGGACGACHKAYKM